VRLKGLWYGVQVSDEEGQEAKHAIFNDTFEFDE
jgi:hypothetical protein